MTCIPDESKGVCQVKKRADSDEPIPSILEPVIDPDFGANGSSKEDFFPLKGMIEEMLSDSEMGVKRAAMAVLKRL